MKFITHVIVTALSLLIAAKLVAGIEIHGLTGAILAAVVLGILNGLVRPVLVVLTIPITILTMGLFILVINATMFYAASLFLDSFYVESFLTAIIGSLVVSVVSLLVNRFIK